MPLNWNIFLQGDHFRDINNDYFCNIDVENNNLSDFRDEYDAVNNMSLMTSFVLGPSSSPLLPSMSVPLILCPHLYCLSIVVWVFVCLFFSEYPP